LAAGAAEAAIGANQPERAAQWKAYQAVLETLKLSWEILHCAGPRHPALSLNQGRDTKQYAALALAPSGDIAHARQLADQLNQDAPVSIFVQGYWLPTILAAILLARDNLSKHWTIFAPLDPTNLSAENFGNLFPVYLHGLAYLALFRARQGVGSGAPEVH
jgi:hypothetical protein